MIEFVADLFVAMRRVAGLDKRREGLFGRMAFVPTEFVEGSRITAGAGVIFFASLEDHEIHAVTPPINNKSASHQKVSPPDFLLEFDLVVPRCFAKGRMKPKTKSVFQS